MSFLVKQWTVEAPEPKVEIRHAVSSNEPRRPRMPEASFGFEVPSQGDGFDFFVGVWLWRLPETGWRRYWPWNRLVKEERHVRELIREAVRQAVRQHSIFNPEQAEASANDAVRFRLTDQLGPGGGLRRRWRAMIELELPDDVKALRRDHESEMYGIETTAKATELRMNRLRKSREDCERFLTAAMESSMAQYSVRLTQSPQDVAEITKDMLDNRRGSAEELLELFTKIVDAQRHANAYELVLSSESALRAAFERLGVPLPPPDPDSPFSLIEETR